MQKPLNSQILIVDDDFAARLQVRFTLENAGFSVLEAESGEDALAAVAAKAPNLILLDVVMPGMDGFATCRAIRALPGGKHVPVVMVTALEDEETITEAFDAGATDFVSKPINLLILGYRVRYWLRAGVTINQLHKSQQNLVKAQEIACLGHWELNLDNGAFKFTSPLPHIFGLSHSCTYERLFDSIVEEERDTIRTIIDNACSREISFSVNYRITLEDKRERIILNQGECIDGPDSSRLLVGIVQDISELKQAEDKIRYLAYYDNLTGLANRSLLREHWSRIMPEAVRQSKKLAVLFIDLDHFKQINDTMGHSSGDKVLVTIADRLKTIFRTSDIISRTNGDQHSSMISRVGGDEFIIIAIDIETPENAAKIAERVIESIGKPIQLEEQEVRLGGSIGLSLFPEDGDDIDQLLKNADTAMYEAKQGGRNRYLFYQKNMNAAVEARFQLGNRLQNALDRGEFILHYQPQYGNDGSIKGVEALIRWNDPERGVIPPIEFLPFAEETGLICRINEWVIWEACKQAQQWVTAGVFNQCRVGINISGNNINFNDIFTTISEALSATELDPRHLEIELTERVMMENTDDAITVLLQLKKMGVSIAIDDFGTGYSALSHLQLFPLTTLKIDKSFVHNLGSSESSRSLLHSIIGIAKSFDLSVVAEGVETELQRSTLSELGCDELQGFLLSKPVPVDRIEQLLMTCEGALQE